MWKSNNRFYTQNLKKEISILFLSKNIHFIPSFKNIRVFSFRFFHITNHFKKLLASFICLQLLSNKKPTLVLAKKSISTKTRKNQPLEAFFFLLSNKAFAFLHSLSFFMFPQLDASFSLFFKKKTSKVAFFFVKSTSFFLKLSFLNFFEFLPSIQILFSMNKKLVFKESLFFFRLLKMPVF